MMRKQKGLSLIAVFVVLIAVLAGGAWYKQSSELAAKKEAERLAQAKIEEARKVKEQKLLELYAALKQLQALHFKWKDTVEVAASTARIQLSSRIVELQSIKRDVNALKFNGCVEIARIYLVESMEYTITGFTEFMADKEFASQYSLSEAGKSMDLFNESVTSCTNQTL